MKCYSGGADGSDLVFENECIKHNIEIVAWSFYGHNTKSKHKVLLTKEELDEGYEHVKIANKTLNRYIYNLSPYVMKLLNRDWFQVKNSEAIFAIGYLHKNMKIVDGGTGWACQQAIDNKKSVYVFDQNFNHWYKFNYENDIFEKYIGIPDLTGNFAGIGTRDIKENGIKAIKDLFRNI